MKRRRSGDWRLLGLALFLVAQGNASAKRPALGEAVEGLRVSLEPTAVTSPIGAAVELEATLTNVGPTPFLADVFGNLDELYQGKHRFSSVPSCWTLSWSGPFGSRGPMRGRYTLSRDQFHRLAPGESYTKRLSATLADVPPGVYRARLAYVPRAASPSFSFPNRWEEQQDLHDPMWLGMAFSNEITLTIVQDPLGSKTPAPQEQNAEPSGATTAPQ